MIDSIVWRMSLDRQFVADRNLYRTFTVANPGFPRGRHPESGGVNLLLPPANKICEGYVFTPVCQSFCSQGGTWAGTPPPEQCMLGDTGNKRAVRILLECILVLAIFFPKMHEFEKKNWTERGRIPSAPFDMPMVCLSFLQGWFQLHHLYIYQAASTSALTLASQDSIPVWCIMPAFKPYLLQQPPLDVRTGGGRFRSHVWCLGEWGSIPWRMWCTYPHPTEWQTDTRENITFPQLHNFVCGR